MFLVGRRRQFQCRQQQTFIEPTGPPMAAAAAVPQLFARHTAPTGRTVSGLSPRRDANAAALSRLHIACGPAWGGLAPVRG